MTKKIAIYGGAFDPPTLGHFYVIEEAFKNIDIEKIIIIPDGKRADKEYNINKKNRIKLIEIFIEELVKKGFNVCLDLGFINNSGEYKTTYDVDKYFRKSLKLSPWHIFGSDIIDDIKHWSGNIDNYVEKVMLKIFVVRPSYNFDLKEFKNYKLIDSEKKIDISSTEVRNSIKNNNSISGDVSFDIEKYIEDNKLYK